MIFINKDLSVEVIFIYDLRPPQLETESPLTIPSLLDLTNNLQHELWGGDLDFRFKGFISRSETCSPAKGTTFNIQILKG